MATSFDLGGLLGSAFGADEYGDLLTPEQQSSIRNRAMLSAAAALLQAGGPSTTRTTLGQALGSALTAGQAGAERAQQSALAGMMTRQKLEEARRAREMEENISRILGGGQQISSVGQTITPDMALAAPVTEGMPAGPTVARAGMIGQAAPAAPAMSPNEMQAQRYRDAARLYTSRGRTEDAKRMIDIAEQLAPTRQKVIGEPIQTRTGWVQRTESGGFIQLPKDFEPQVKVKPIGEPLTVTDEASGNQILVQRFDDNTIKPLEGFGPKRDVVLQTIDGKTVAIDKSKVTAGQTFGTGRNLQFVDVDGTKQLIDLNATPVGTVFGKGQDLQLVDVDGQKQLIDLRNTPVGTKFGTGQNIQIIEVDGQKRAVDLKNVAPGTTFGTGISPVEQARLDIEREKLNIARERLKISQDEFNRGNYQRMETPGGIVYVPTTPGGKVIPLTDAAGKPLMGIEGQQLDIARRRLNISEAEFARGAYERTETANGIVYVSKVPGRPIIPLTDAAGKPLMGASGSARPTQEEAKAAGFSQRMEASLYVIGNLPQGSQPGVRAAVAGALPIIGGVAQRGAMSAEQQKYKQAADDWIRAKLRQESGAVIGEDEMRKEFETYFPQVGDKPEVIAQKEQARAIATNAMRTTAGRAYQPYVPPPPAQVPKEGDTSKDRNNRNIVFRNGQWVYQ
jgi:hypothetical protein